LACSGILDKFLRLLANIAQERGFKPVKPGAIPGFSVEDGETGR
jgi:hypothetical protein